MKFLHSSNRLEGISDAVFAFAATLLVVSLEVPDSFAELQNQLKGFMSFGISFLALVLIWKTHYNFFRRTSYMDNWIIAFNMFLLFVVLYFVYPLKFLATLPFQGALLSIDDFAMLFELYSLGFSMIFLCISLMYYRAGQKTKDPLAKSKLLFYTRHFGIFVFMGIVSMILAGLKIGLVFALPGIIYSLLGPLCWFHGAKFGYEEAE
ncbi:MAG: TMEM175 family protein [Bacteroidota bacterium]